LEKSYGCFQMLIENIAPFYIVKVLLKLNLITTLNKMKYTVYKFSMMKKIISILAFLTLVINVNFAQIVKPVKWSFESKKVSDTEFDLVATAKLDKGWFIYSQTLVGDGPIPTKFTFKPTPQYQLVGGVPKEVSDHKKAGFDPIFDMNVTKYSESVQFVQRVKLTGAAAQISGSVEFMSCDSEKCLPPSDEEFNFNVSSGAGTSRGAVTPPTNVPTQSANPPQGAPQPSKPNLPAKPNQTGVTSKSAPQPKPAVVPKSEEDISKKLIVNENEPWLGTSKSSGIKDPVKWTFESKKISDTEYDIVAKATIESGWHIYSQFLRGDGPIPTALTLENGEKVGNAKEESPKKREHNDPNFDNMKVVDFEESATFTQHIKVKNQNEKVKGSVQFMACTDGMCLPPTDVAFDINLLTGKNDLVSGIVDVPTTQNQEGGNLLTPSQFSFDKADINSSCGTTKTETADYSNLWWVFLQGLLGGCVAILMPCIFPLIPMTVAYFTKGTKDRATGIRHAIIYGLSIVVIYVALGLFISTVFGSDALNRFASNAWVNIAFGVLFLVFAISFFGYFEIGLPSSWTNKADAASQKGGLSGIFFMAFTLALVSFSCTGPIIGNLLVQSATGSSLAPAIGMLGFGVALGLPFALFAAFPAWLKTLPKSGGWMDDVKVTLGFVEIALAFKFFSNADLAKNWKVLPYEGFLGIWMLCALGLILYYVGIFKVHGHKSAIKSTAVKGGLVALCLMIFTYCGLGFQYSNVTETFKTPKLMSGIVPPAGYSYIYPSKCPLNIECFHDLNEGVAYAKSVNKPILLDFTGYSCANCRKMENYVWPEPGVRELIEQKYVLISLYVDDPKELKAPYQTYVSDYDNRTKKDYGDMWAELQARHFDQNTQPYYVLLSPDKKVLNNPKGTTLDVKEYRDFLQCGIDRFQANKGLLGQK
jgi:thiol:disulfide interchange protein